jgi:WD40 repeat protein/tRNA A-37 threonylcarbamoyl transferase component Bud32
VPPPPNDNTQTIAPREGRDSRPLPTVHKTPSTPTPSNPGTGEIPVTAEPLGVDDPDRYELAGEHARGGLGRVVRAVDRRLGRTVAVKELLKQSELAEALFVREALITARLQHPGIVPVHEAGRWPTGEPYYVMKLVQGRTLKELIGETRTARDRLALLPHVIAVADAIGYAHSEQVIHRDVKPSNIIVGGHGETVVVDWGLARDGRRDVPELDVDAIARDANGSLTSTASTVTTPTRAAATQSGGGTNGGTTTATPGRVSTVSGRVIGTPAYMPPEQARGEVVDERADVYAIGAVLYETLSGAPPYHGDTPREIVDRVLTRPPRPLADAAPGIPADLIAIVHKAMSRNPDERYRTARELAADLRRYATGQMVTAHHYGTMLLARRWLRRHRAPVAVAAVGSIALVVTTIMFIGQVVDQRNAARTERARAIDEARRAEDRQAELIRLQAKTSLRRDPTAAVAWLKAYPDTAPHQDELADVLDEAVSLGVARHVLRHPAWVLDAAFSPDGAKVATAGKDGAVRLYDVASGAGTELGRQAGGVEALAYAPDGSAVAAGGDRVMLWPTDGGPARPLLEDSGGTVVRIAFSSDSKLVLVAREQEPLLVIEAARPENRSEVAVPRDAFRIAWAADHWQTVLAATVDGEIASLVPTRKVIAKLPRGLIALTVDRAGERYVAYDGETIFAGDVGGGAPIALGKFAGPALRLDLSPDGKWVVLGGDSHDIWLYDVGAKKERLLRGHTDAIYGFAFAADGRRMVSASDDGTARIWDLHGGESTALRGHEDDVYRARFSPDGTWVVTASLDGSARLWDVASAGVRVLGPDDGAILAMKASGDAVITAGPGFASRWDLATGTKTSVASLPPQGPRKSYWKASTPLMTPDGSVVASIGDNDTIVVQADGVRRVLEGHQGWISEGELTKDGKTLYSGSRDGTVREWDVATGVGKVLYQAKGPVGAMTLSEDGRLAFSADEAVIEVGPDGHPQKLGEGRPWCVRMMAFDARGRLLMYRCNNTAGVYAPGAGIVDLHADGYTPVRIAASPDGKSLAGAMADRTVVIWDAATGRQVSVLRGHTDLVLGLAWSPDGARIASASYDHTVRLWDIERGTSRVLRGHASAVDAVAWLEDGRIVSGGRDATVRIWTPPPRDTPSPAEVRTRLASVTTAKIGPDDRPATRVD